MSLMMPTRMPHAFSACFTSGSVGVGHGCGEIAVALPDGEHEFVIEASESKLERGSGPVQVGGTVGVQASGQDLRMGDGIFERTGQHRRGVVREQPPDRKVLR